jgi:hypothetical protein
MGREIRRVPANWEHPKYTQDTASRQNQIGCYCPLHGDYEQTLLEFEKDIKGKGLREAIDYHGGGPRSEDHAQYGGKECTWWQLYETVTEGTPVSPPFATPEELVYYLRTKGDFWGRINGEEPYSREAAEQMVSGGWAPTGVFAGGKFYNGAEALTLPKDKPQ